MVPSHFLLISDKDYTFSWAGKTYNYRCVSSSRFLFTSPMHVNLLAWISKAKDLCKELREYGTVKAEEQIVCLCRQYNSRLP